MTHSNFDIVHSLTTLNPSLYIARFSKYHGAPFYDPWQTLCHLDHFD